MGGAKRNPSSLFVTEAFDNSKKPVACFEGPGSIFREHREGGKKRACRKIPEGNG